MTRPFLLIARLLLVPILILPIAGCVKAPPRTEPEVDTPVPEAWAANPDASSAEVQNAWWRTFQDPELDRLVQLAVEQNYDLVAAAARVEQALERAVISGADLKPSVGFGVDATRQKNNTSAFGGAIPGNQSFQLTRVSAQFQVSWEADVWGRIRAQARSAAARVESSQADYSAARLSLAGQIAKIWFAIAEAREQIALAENSAESFHDLSEQVRRRFERGTRPAIDLRLALSNEAAARSANEFRRHQLDATVRRMEILLGEYPAGDLLDDYSTRPLPPTPPPIPMGLPAAIVARRPDLLAAERLVVASDQSYLSAKRSLYPRLTLTASGGSATQALTDLLDGDFGVWTIAAGLLQPIFEGGRLKANVRLADATADEAIARYAGLVLNAYSEVESALAAESFLARQEAHLADAAQQLVAAERLATQRYRLGIGGYLEVLESQTRAFTAQSQLLSTRRERLSNRIDLHLALGGGFDLPEWASDDEEDADEEEDDSSKERTS